MTGGAARRDGTAAGRLPEAVAFDCDGTIADTESLSERAWAEVLAAHGHRAGAADFAALVGRPYAANWAYFSERVDLGDAQVFRAEVRRVFLELFDAGLEVYPDAVGVMGELAALGVPIVVVSSSTHDHVARVLERSGVSGLVRDVVASGDTVAEKPDPAPYLEACRRLAVPAARMSAVEDTVTGAGAAAGAGMWTVAVRRQHATPALADVAHAVVDRLTLDVLRHGARDGSDGGDASSAITGGGGASHGAR
jgi:HAD superfamily hydrolase (TIGR01509 family)